MERVYFAARWDKGTADYINCPMDRAESTTAFYDALLAAEAAEAKEWEKLDYFEGCLPIEVLARRGRDTLRFGPMKPVGLRDPRTGQDAVGGGAAAQGESARRQLQPCGLSEPLEIWRTGAGAAADSGTGECDVSCAMGRFIATLISAAPVLLDETLRLKSEPRILFAGQISGVEGYTESIATGMLAGIYAAAMARGEEPMPVPRETALGSLVHYITHADPEALPAGEYHVRPAGAAGRRNAQEDPRQEGAAPDAVRAGAGDV